MKKLLLTLLSLMLVVSLCSCRIVGDYGMPELDVEKETAGGDDTFQDFGGEVDYEKPVTEEFVTAVTTAKYRTPKNVILMINDGMGPNDVALAEKYAEGKYDVGLLLNKLTDCGYVTTFSANSEVTDSAAAGTALSTGFKTHNGCVGVSPDGTELKTLGEIAREAGKRVGIVTDDDVYGATPSAFMTHSADRHNYGELALGALSFAPDVLIGRSFNDFMGYLPDDKKTELENKYSVAKDLTWFESAYSYAAEHSLPFAGFNGGCTETPSDHLAKSVEVALKLLENEDGFFLMIEGEGADVYGHSNVMEGKLSGVITFDRALATVLRFMEKNPDTLLVVTSDHETGGVRLPAEGESPANDCFTATSHTSADVRVFALGEGSGYFKGKTVDNTDVSRFVISAVKGEEYGG